MTPTPLMPPRHHFVQGPASQDAARVDNHHLRLLHCSCSLWGPLRGGRAPTAARKVVRGAH